MVDDVPALMSATFPPISPALTSVTRESCVHLTDVHASGLHRVAPADPSGVRDLGEEHVTAPERPGVGEHVEGDHDGEHSEDHENPHAELSMGGGGGRGLSQI
jgi:hypothetical protein